MPQSSTNVEQRRNADGSMSISIGGRSNTGEGAAYAKGQSQVLAQVRLSTTSPSCWSTERTTKNKKGTMKNDAGPKPKCLRMRPIYMLLMCEK